MIRAVAQVGRTVYAEEVEAFQMIWNQSQKLVDKAAALNGAPPYWYQLAEDGKYGPKTAGALRFVVSRNVPDKAGGMATWYAANHDFVDALVSPSDASAQQTLEAAAAPLDESSADSAVDPEAVVEAARQGGNGSSSVPSSPPPPPAPGGNDGPAPLWCDELPEGERQMCWFQRHDIVNAAAGKCREVLTVQGEFDVVCDDWAAAMGVPADALDWDPATSQPAGASGPAPAEIQNVSVPESYETRVRAAPTKGAVPLVALGAGALALGGVLYYFTRRKRA